MGRRGYGGGLVGSLVLACVPTPRAHAQALAAVPRAETAHAFYAAPGNYGTSFGTASYGMARSYSSFASPYGAGYAQGYAPSAFIDGPYGMGLWRPGGPQYPLWNAASHSYRTFPVSASAAAAATAVLPRIGDYAPAFGPSSVPGH